MPQVAAKKRKIQLCTNAVGCDSRASWQPRDYLAFAFCCGYETEGKKYKWTSPLSVLMIVFYCYRHMRTDCTVYVPCKMRHSMELDCQFSDSFRPIWFENCVTNEGKAEPCMHCSLCSFQFSNALPLSAIARTHKHTQKNTFNGIAKVMVPVEPICCSLFHILEFISLLLLSNSFLFSLFGLLLAH